MAFIVIAQRKCVKCHIIKLLYFLNKEKTKLIFSQHSRISFGLCFVNANSMVLNKGIRWRHREAVLVMKRWEKEYYFISIIKFSARIGFRECVRYWFLISNFLPTSSYVCACAYMHVLCTKVEISFPFSIWIISIFYWIHSFSSVVVLFLSHPQYFKSFAFQFRPPFFHMHFQCKTKIFFHSSCTHTHSKGIPKVKKYSIFFCKSFLYITNANLY